VSRISIAILAAALWLAAPFAAHAAGLGRLTVLSPLGQPLNAEIEIVSTHAAEEEGLVARLAPMQAFVQAGIEASPALAGIRFSIDRRDGRPVLRVTTPQPINEPFLDLLVELEWNTGRLVREYTFLLDPPEYKGPQAIAAAPPPKPAASAPAAKPLPPVEAKPAPQPAAPAEEPATTAAAAPETKQHEVKQGDTLGAIARQNLPPGMSLNQMLIAIYRANPDAFIRENINLVRAGRILSIPSAETVGTLDTEDANRLVQAHRSEWNEYRSRLAATPARAEAVPGQSAVTGQIEAKPQAAPPAVAQDQLRLSKADPKKPEAADSRAASADDAAARERALKEAQSRLTDLEKNVADLQKLLELKNQQLAELEKKAGVKSAPTAPATAPAPAPAAKAPQTAPAKPEAPKPEAVKPAPAQPTTTPAPVAAPEQKKAESPVEAKKAEPAPKPKPKAVPPPPPAPSLLDEFIENPIALAGLAVIILILVVYGLWAWRRKKATQAKFQDSVLGAAASGSSVFPAGEAGAGAGAGAASEVSINQPVAGMEGEEVDPIAEADVYMAYGRDAQAEEILKEALQKDPNRLPVQAKLLEIYAKRHDTKSFEQTALRVKSVTGGSGPEWDKAAALGRSIDPDNGLYGGGARTPAAAPAAAAAAAVAAAPALDFDLGGATTPGTGTPDVTLDQRPKDTATNSVDFDLGAATLPPSGAKETTDFTPEGTLIMDDKKPESMDGGLDFDLDIGGSADDTKPQPAPAPAAQEEHSGGLDFDLNLDLGTGGAETPAEAERAAAPLDLSAISLDLGSAGEPSGAGGSSNDPKWQEVATKLDLAKAYEEMGDKDGARELLNEVMKDGDGAQKGQAEQLLTRLG
jgi:pilus assembly protein FimV